MVEIVFYLRKLFCVLLFAISRTLHSQGFSNYFCLWKCWRNRSDNLKLLPTVHYRYIPIGTDLGSTVNVLIFLSYMRYHTVAYDDNGESCRSCHTFCVDWVILFFFRSFRIKWQICWPTQNSLTLITLLMFYITMCLSFACLVMRHVLLFIAPALMYVWGRTDFIIYIYKKWGWKLSRCNLDRVVDFLCNFRLMAMMVKKTRCCSRDCRVQENCDERNVWWCLQGLTTYCQQLLGITTPGRKPS